MWPFGRGGLKRCWGWKKSSKAASRVLVSVYVQPKALPSRGLSSTSRRILLTTSVWSALAVLFIFFFTYTVLLVSVDPPFHKASSTRGQLIPGASANHAKPRWKFLGRAVGSRNSSFTFSHQLTPFWDLAQLEDGTVEAPVCLQGSLFIILITSAPDHFHHRKEIRRTWCDSALSSQKEVRWQCVFLVGRTNDSKVAARVQSESLHRRDLLRGSYLDSYRNLTHKVMHGLSWVASRCEAPYLLKTDDDCFVNTVLLQQFLLHYNTQTTGLYAGGMVVKKEKRKVIRRPNEKWSVSPDDYLPEYYPMYASGSGYVLSFDVVSRAVQHSRYIKPIPNEDAYVGILMDRLQVPPKLSGRFTLSSGGLRVCNFLYIFVAHGVAPSMHQEMCTNMLAAQRECQSKEEVTDW